MSYNIVATSEFQKEIKRLARKHPLLSNDFKIFLLSLEKNLKKKPYLIRKIIERLRRHLK